MSILLPFLFLVGSSGTLVLLTRRRFEEVAPLAMMVSTLLVFASGFLGSLTIGFWAACGLALLFPVLAVIGFIRRKRIPVLTESFFTPGFVLFVVLYLFVCLLNWNRGFTVWDEVSHWGPMVKETLRLDQFYSVPESALSVHKDYPPAISLFEALWCRLSGGYSETNLYRSLQMLSLSLFLPALRNLQWKKSGSFLIKLVLLVGGILSVPLIIRVGEASFYQTIYIDCFMGLIFAYCTYLAVCESPITKFGIFRLSVSLIFLLLTKQMGLVFFLLVLGIFVVNACIVNRDRFRRNTIRSQFTKRNLLTVGVVFLSLAVVPYLVSTVWNVYVSVNGIPRQFNISNIQIFSLLDIARGTGGEPYQHEAFVNFARSFALDSYFDRPFSLTYWQLMLVAVGVFWLIGRFGKGQFAKYQIGGLNVLLFLGALGYAFAMLLLYVYNFGSYEGPRLASIYRYFNTYWFGVSTLAMMLFLQIEGRKEQEHKSVRLVPTAALILVLWVVVFSSDKILNFKPAISGDSVTSEFQDDAAVIEQYTTEEDHIFVISQDTAGFDNYILRYLTIPRYFNNYWYSLGAPYDETGSEFTKDITPEEWEAELHKWDYLYLYHIDDQFLEKYTGVFDEPDQLRDGQLYRIVQEADGTLQLQLITG